MDDLISRQAALDILNSAWKTPEELEIFELVKSLPSVQSKQKVGKWINAKVGRLFPSHDFKCSECGNILNFDGVNCGRGDANYCPNCGAKMIEPQEVKCRNECYN